MGGIACLGGAYFVCVTCPKSQHLKLLLVLSGGGGRLGVECWW